MSAAFRSMMPSFFSLLMCLVCFGCEKQPPSKPAQPANTSTTPTTPPPKASKTPEAVRPPALSPGLRAIPMRKDLFFPLSMCAPWDHAARRTLEAHGQNMCLAWIDQQTTIQKSLPSQAYHVPKSARVSVNLNPGDEITPELIDWHVTHRVFLPADCSKSLPKGLVYVTCKRTPANGRHLKAASTIRHLDLSFNAGAKDAMKAIGEMTQLESLRLEQQPLDATSVSHLSALANLRVLHLIRVGLDDAGLAHLSKLTGLTELSIPYNKGITDQGMASIAQINALKTLDIRSIGGLSNKGLAALKPLQGLEHLSCGGAGSRALGVSAESLLALEHLKALTYLNTGALTLDEGAAKVIGSLPKLQTYKGTIPSGDLLAFLGQRTTLHVLAIQGDLGADALKHLAGLKDLRSLYINLLGPKTLKPIDDTTLRHISALTGLRDLRMPSRSATASSITDAGLAHFSALKELRLLSLGHSVITGEGLNALASLPIMYLSIGRTKVGPEGVPALLKLKQLDRLTLNGTNMNKEALTKLRAGLPSCKANRCIITPIRYR